MKLQWVVLGIALLLGGCKAVKPGDDIRMVKIMYVDFGVATFVAVDCDGFEKSFGDGDKTVVVEDDNTFIGLLNDKLAALETDGTTPKQNVRVKVLITRASGEVDVLCVSLGDMVYKGKGVKFDKELLDLIVSRVNK